MSNTPYFSVIMPAYGVEKYLENAVNSILNQSFKDFEIIIVDDASMDNSSKIADELAKKYENIKVIHHETNRGLSEARNTGLRYATGYFVFFMDPDDTVENNLFEQIKSALEKQSSNVVVFGMVEDYYNQNNELQNSVPIAYSNETVYLKNAQEVHEEVIKLEKKTFYGYAWNKVYNREYLEKINAKFETIVLIEDIVFNVDVFQELDSLIILSETPYHYMKRMDNSLTNKFVPDYFKVHRQRVSIILEQHKRWNCCTDYVKSELGCIYARYILSAIQRNCDKRADMNFKKRLDFIKNLYADELFNETVLNASSENRLVKIVLILLKKKLTLALAILGKLVYFVKNKLPIFFSKIKQNK